MSYQLIPSEYRIQNGCLIPGLQTRIVERITSDGSAHWVVLASGKILNKEGLWEVDLLPSNRSKEYLQRTYFKSPREAFTVYLAAEHIADHPLPSTIA